jgi:hypothetical protein
MAIFRCVGSFYFRISEGICFAGGYTLHVSIGVFLVNFAVSCVCACLLAFSCPAHRQQHNLQNPLNNTMQQDAKI